MATPDESGVLRQLINQIDSEISTFQVGQDGFSSGQSSLVGSNDSFGSRSGRGKSQESLTQKSASRASGVPFQSEPVAPLTTTFTEQGKALFGDSSEWIQAELYGSGSLGAPSLASSSSSSLGRSSSTDLRKRPSDSKINDGVVSQSGTGTGEGTSEGVSRNSSHGATNETLLAAPQLLELSFSNSDLTSLIDTADAFADDEGLHSGPPSPSSPSVTNTHAKALGHSVPAMVSAPAPSVSNLKYQASFPPKHSSPLKKGFVVDEDDSGVGTIKVEITSTEYDAKRSQENVSIQGTSDTDPLQSEQETLPRRPSLDSTSSGHATEDIEPTVVPRRHGTTGFRDQVRAERKRLSLVTTGVGLASGVPHNNGGNHHNNRIGSVLNLPSWELAPLSPPVFVKETSAATTTTAAATASTSTSSATTAAPAATPSVRSPPPTRKLPPPPDQQECNTPSTATTLTAGETTAPASATTTMTPTTPLSTREARILAGREVLLRSSPESYRLAHRTASIMSTSSTTSSLTTGGRSTAAHNDPAAMGSAGDASSMEGGKNMSTPTGAVIRQQPGMSALQYWKLVQDQEQQSLNGVPGAGGVFGAIPGRGRMVELWSQVTSNRQGTGDGNSQERSEDVEVHKDGVIKVRPEQLVFPDQSIRPVPLKAFRVRKMTLMERSQEYAQACYEFSKARTGLDVWILRSMMQDRPEVMKDPPKCVLQAQKAHESAMAGARRASKDVSHFYINSNHSWNTASTVSLNSPMSASTPTSAMSGGGGSGLAGAGSGSAHAFGSVSSTTAGSFVGGARAKIKNAGKRLSMEISHPFGATGPNNAVPSMMEDGRRSSLSTHSQQGIRAPTPSDKYKSGGVESPFYKQKTTKSAVELGSWSSQRARALSEHQNQQQNQDPLQHSFQQQPGQQDGVSSSGPLSTSLGSQRDSFHQYYQQHQRQQQQGSTQATMQRSSTIGSSSSFNTSVHSITGTNPAATAAMTAAAAAATSNRQRHSISGPGSRGPGTMRSRTAVDLLESSTVVGRRSSMMEVGTGSTGDGSVTAQSPFNSISGRRRSMMGPNVEPTDRYGSNGGSYSQKGIHSSSLPSQNGVGAASGPALEGSGHKHEISQSASVSSLSSTSSSTVPTTASTTPAGMNSSGNTNSNMSQPPKPNLPQLSSSLSARRRPMSMMVNTTLTSLAEHQAMTTTETPPGNNMAMAGMVGGRPSTLDNGHDHGHHPSIPLADETTSKEIYSPLTSPIVIPEGGFNILPGSTLALRAAAMNSPPASNEGGGFSGGMTRPLTFAGYGSATMSMSSFAIGQSPSSSSLMSEADGANSQQGGGGLSPKSSKKKKDGSGSGHDSLGFKKSFRRDLSFKRSTKLGLGGNKNEPNSPVSASSSVSTATGASMMTGLRPASSISGGGGGGGVAAADMHGSVMTMNMTEALWEQSLDKLSDVLPHIDRDRLLIYLQRAGGDEMIAIGLAMSDLRSGDLY